MNIKETIKSKVRDYVAETKRSIHTAKKIGLVLLVTNSMAFSTVAMQRGISGYSKEEAAFINSLNAVPVLYDIGFELGQRVFLAMPTSTKADNWIANEGIVRQISQDAVQTTISENSVLLGSPLFNTTGELVGMGATGKDGKIFAASISKIQALLGL